MHRGAVARHRLVHDGRAQPRGDLGRAVGRPVVHDDHREARRDPRQQRRQRGRLVPAREHQVAQDRHVLDGRGEFGRQGVATPYGPVTARWPGVPIRWAPRVETMTSAAVSRRRAPALGLVVTACSSSWRSRLPHWLDWEVAARAPRNASPHEVPPLARTLAADGVRTGHAPGGADRAARLAVRRRPGRPAALAAAAAGVVRRGSGVAARRSRSSTGPTGSRRVLGNPYEYLETARGVGDVSALLDDLRRAGSRTPPTDNWPTHVAGHPPGAAPVLRRAGAARPRRRPRPRAGRDRAGRLDRRRRAGHPARAWAPRTLARRAAPFLVLDPCGRVHGRVRGRGDHRRRRLGHCRAGPGRHRPGRRALGWSVLAGLLLGWAC